ncbi:hypothetical protein HG536_0A04460 [Torulaspora globosa]|uniref:Uncharacterized protein n=1 Tax=Torulaspora globosa TaxID=48254 RepID=A0A7G3ZAU3_9SACH|nr:uncharacterized protein HG536_0A04460 [Torulaspora globosa]QLL30629.1 hypothetical protein HG536_0A04460 [Torulaspora globosa]
MGLILSCCREGELDENEALLASQQNGYGAHEDYNALQQQMKEHEERLRARENTLKEIVTNTNDKLIDISMISNSGIVIQGTDLKNPDPDALENASGSTTRDNQEHTPEQNRSSKSNFVPLDTKTAMSQEMKKHLKLLHQTIFETLDDELRVEPRGQLIVTLY